MALIILPAGSTSTDLQALIDGAAFGDVIQLSGDVPFSDKVTIRSGLEITIRSAVNNHWIMSQFNPGIRHFEINGGSLILENTTLDGRQNGGGVQLSTGAFAIQHGAIITNCLATNGGGVEVVAGMFAIYDGDISTGLPIKGGEVRGNSATSGGGVYLRAGTFNMSASTGFISENTATDGGGVYVNSGTYFLYAGIVSDNKSVNGGGLYMNSGTFDMSRGIFENNIAETNGGGIYATSAATLGITGTTSSILNNNAGENGGGIYTASTDYSNLTTGRIIFRCNTASIAYAPPAGAEVLYPDILFAETTITDHPLNNYDINCTITEPITVTHNATYNANGGTGSHTGPDIGPCETDTAVFIENTNIVREGYSFIGWNTEADGSGISYLPGDEIDLTSDLTLYAQWEKSVCSVTYNSNGGTGYYFDTPIACGIEYTVLSLKETKISYNGKIFVGWNTKPDKSGTDYSPGDKMLLSGDVILYAQWKKHDEPDCKDFCEVFCKIFSRAFAKMYCNDCCNGCHDNCCDRCRDNCCDKCRDNNSGRCRDNCSRQFRDNYSSNFRDNYSSRCRNNNSSNFRDNYSGKCSDNYSNNCCNDYSDNCCNDYPDNCCNDYPDNCCNDYSNNCCNKCTKKCYETYYKKCYVLSRKICHEICNRTCGLKSVKPYDFE